MARLERQNALASALELLGLEFGGTSPAPRFPGLPEPAASWAIANYKQLGGMLEAPTLRPLGWDIQTTMGSSLSSTKNNTSTGIEQRHFERSGAPICPGERITCACAPTTSLLP